MSTDAIALRAALDTINAAWSGGGTEPLRALFHPDMVICGPGHQRYAAAELATDMWGDTAVGTPAAAA